MVKKPVFKRGKGEIKKGKYPYLVLVLLFGTAIMLISNIYER